MKFVKKALLNSGDPFLHLEAFIAVKLLPSPLQNRSGMLEAFKPILLSIFDHIFVKTRRMSVIFDTRDKSSEL